MPPYSSIRTFITALQTGRTNITESLERLMSDHAALRQHPHFQDFRRGRAADAPMPAWTKAALRASGMKNEEIAHIDGWPDLEKDVVRAVMAGAVDAERTVHFFWELHRGAAAQTEIIDPDEWGDVTVIFRSPRAGVQLSANNSVDVQV